MSSVQLRAWFWATRPFSLQASVVPVLVGSALALKVVSLNWLLFALALVGSVSIQVATNLTDEYSDHRRTRSAVKFLAPHKVIERGLLSEQAVLVGTLAAFGAGIGIGLYIVWEVGWPILAVGLASVAVACMYSSGPHPLGHLGLGEVTVFVFMGPVMVMAAYYVQVQELSWTALGASVPVAFLVTAILHCNNLRDVAEDQEDGKRTLASAMSAIAGRWLYVGMLTAAYASLVALVATGTLHPLALVGLSAVPRAVATTVGLWKAEGRPALNRALVSTSQLHGLTGVTLAGGLALSTLV